MEIYQSEEIIGGVVLRKKDKRGREKREKGKGGEEKIGRRKEREKEGRRKVSILIHAMSSVVGPSGNFCGHLFVTTLYTGQCI